MKIVCINPPKFLKRFFRLFRKKQRADIVEIKNIQDTKKEVA
ncbi:MAG: hypothetical protein RR357_05230 [Clostridia bacterium]